MPAPDGGIKAERQIVWLPVIAGSLLTVNGLAGGLITGSRAVMADGLFSLVFVATGLFTVYVTRLLARAESAHFPYGYAAFEPLTNVIKAVLMLGVTAAMAWEAVAGILTGGHPLTFGPVVLFAGVSALISLAAAGFVWWRSRSAATPLVEGEVMNWTLDALSVIGVALALALGWWLDSSGLPKAAAYVDPVVTLLLALATVYPPAALARRSLFQLLGRVAAEDVRRPFEDAAREVLDSLPLTALQITVLEVGRVKQVRALAVLDPYGEDIRVVEADSLRSQLQERLAALDVNARAELLLTCRLAPDGAGEPEPTA